MYSVALMVKASFISRNFGHLLNAALCGPEQLAQTGGFVDLFCLNVQCSYVCCLEQYEHLIEEERQLEVI